MKFFRRVCKTGLIEILKLQRGIRCRKDLFYSLEEDMEDWNRDKMIHAASALFQMKNTAMFGVFWQAMCFKGSRHLPLAGRNNGWPGMTAG